MPDQVPVTGALHSADKDGFQSLLHEANLYAAKGYELVTVVAVGSQLGSVFRLRKDPERVASLV